MLSRLLGRALAAVVLLVTAAQEKAARSCWSGAFSEDLCCDTDLYGPAGNSECWEGAYSYAACCPEDRGAASAAAARTQPDATAQGLAQGPPGDRGLCWGGVFSEARCCDTAAHGPGGDAACWSEGLDFARCCGPPRAARRGEAWAAAAAPEAAAPGAAEEAPRAEPMGALAVSMRCWRGGFNYAFCCARDRPGGNPECWDGLDFTYERCCRPPELLPAAFVFEDVNCGGDEPEWRLLERSVHALVQAADVGRLRHAAEAQGGFGALSRSLRRSAAGLEGACPIGRVAVEAAALLLCLAAGPAGRSCRVHWAAAARAMRGDALSVAQWSATTWPVLRVFRHVAGIVARDDPTCAAGGAAGVDWPLLHAEARAAEELSKRAMAALFGMDGATSHFDAPCEGGHQWAATVKMSWCAKSEVKCVLSYSMFLDWRMRRAAASGRALERWLELAGAWRLQDWQAQLLEGVMRHHYALGLRPAELRALGAEPATEAPERCAELPPGGGGAELELLPPQDAGSGRPLGVCRVRCGSLYDPAGRPWALYGAVGDLRNLRCACAGAGAPPAAGNCSAEGRVLLHSMPEPRLEEDLRAHFARLGLEAPVFRQASSSLEGLRAGAPVFVTMVFGHMAKYLERALRNAERLGIPNVVVYVLDEGADRACRSARSALGGHHGPFCLRGEGKTALQKYVVVLTYVALGRDVFWFDFDSVWLQSPLPALRAAEAAARDAEVLAAIDFDSKNCVMNAFFLVKASRSTRVWLLSLLHWIYRRPFVHDQVAFAQLLGIGPLVDEEPLPKLPDWSPLDPNVFANAARFSGLGFSSRVEDLVLFHFFDGWNSNMPDEVEQWATPVYRGVNIFEVLYGGDAEAARALIAKSRLPPPEKLNDCSYMTTLGLGVDVQSGGRVAIPAV